MPLRFDFMVEKLKRRKAAAPKLVPLGGKRVGAPADKLAEPDMQDAVLPAHIAKRRRTA